MTYLQLVNKVLRELRETQVTVLTADYSALIAQFVNDAKEEIEDCGYQWKALRTTLTFNTANGTRTYNLGTGGVASGGTTTERSKLLYDDSGWPQVYNTTQKTQLQEAPVETMAGRVILNQSQATQPFWFYLTRAYTGVSMVFDPAPNATYAMSARFYIPQAELSATTDVLTIPAEPVWRLALAMAASERSGGQGESVAKLEKRAANALTSAIMQDMAEGDLTVVPV